MSKTWLIVDAETRSVYGWQRGKTVPTAPAGREHWEVGSLAPYMAIRSAMREERRSDCPAVDAEGNVFAPVDTRQTYRASVDSHQIAAGQDVSLSLTCLSIPNLSGEFVVEIPGFEKPAVLLAFVDGVASRAVTLPNTGVFTATSTGDYRLEDPVTVTVYE